LAYVGNQVEREVSLKIHKIFLKILYG